MSPAQRQRHSLNDPSMALHPKLANSSAAPRYKSLKLPEDFELSPRLPACFSRDPSRTRGEIQGSCCSAQLAAAQMEAALLSARVSQAVGLWGCANRAEPKPCGPQSICSQPRPKALKSLLSAQPQRVWMNIGAVKASKHP